MKILVLNGSPKGEVSVTMQYVKYLQRKLPGHEFKIINIAQDIRRIEREEAAFTGILEDVRASDGVLWAFPLYVLLVHANYKRFIELIFERGAGDAFKDKYTAVLSTSIHFFDHTAHNYMRAICDDLEMHYTGSFSAGMNDLIEDDSRKKLVFFAKDLLSHIEKKLPTVRRYMPVEPVNHAYKPGMAAAKVDNSTMNVLLITEGTGENANLRAMVERFKNAFTHPVVEANLNTAKIKGGCLGCLQCGFNNECVYGDSDDIKQIYDEMIPKADIIVIAAAMKDRYFSARLKTWIDRRFMHTHQPIMGGKQIGYLASGPLSRNENLWEMCAAITELDRANLAGIITDEEKDSAAIDKQIDSLAATMVEMAKAGYIQPRTFYGVGGAKLFRDEIWLGMRFAFQGDHKYFKKHKMYDFPQKQMRTRLMIGFLILASKIPNIQKYMKKNMKTLMLRDYEKILLADS